MGGGQSKSKEPVISLEKALEENKYHAQEGCKYPFYVVQLDEKEELPYKGVFVSDAIVEHIKKNDFTHLIVQTHGWNTSPQKAIAVPFKEFIGGMQNDKAMPTEDFNPLFVTFIWPSMPNSLADQEDARTRMELVIQNETNNGHAESDIVKAAAAAKKAIENENADDEELVGALKVMAQKTKEDKQEADSEDDSDDEPDVKVEKVREEAKNGVFKVIGGAALGLTLNVASRVLSPFEFILFGRLISRGNRVGKVMETVLAKFMKAKEEPLKVCMMANSLGAHVLAGCLRKPKNMPYKIHTVFFVQGAVETNKFADGGKFSSCKDSCAGPILSSYSNKDRTLRYMFDFFRDTPLGWDGFPGGQKVEMKSLEEYAEVPYQLKNQEWNSVNGSR